MKKKNITFYVLIIVGALILGLGNYYFIQRPKVFHNVTDAAELIGSWQDKYRAMLTFTFEENNNLLIGSSTDGEVFHISKYFITNNALYIMNSAGKTANNAVMLSANKKKFYFLNDTNIIYYKKSNEEKNYNIVKDASEIIGGWGYVTNNLTQGYLFTKEQNLIMFINNVPLPAVLKYGITNSVYYTVKEGQTNTDGFPIILSKDKSKMYLFGWVDKYYTKVLDENNNLIPQK